MSMFTHFNEKLNFVKLFPYEKIVISKMYERKRSYKTDEASILRKNEKGIRMNKT